MERDLEKVKLNPEYLLLSGDKFFYTLQGEGVNIGKPAVFLRLHTCNLTCSWCDTKYTWDKSLPEFWEEPEKWSFERVLKEIEKTPTKRLVITGGEPLIQQKQIEQLLKILPNWQVEIETNGTIIASSNLIKRCQFNVSPKLSNSNIPQEKRIKPHVLTYFNQYPNTYFKFVVQTPFDMMEVDEIVKKHQLKDEKIIIMPEGVTQEQITQHAQNVVEMVKERNWMLIPRLQVLIWGQERAK